jgi:hypothetical protein
MTPVREQLLLLLLLLTATADFCYCCWLLLTAATVATVATASCELHWSPSNFFQRGRFWGSMLHGHFRQTTKALPTRVEPGEPHKL